MWTYACNERGGKLAMTFWAPRFHWEVNVEIFSLSLLLSLSLRKKKREILDSRKVPVVKRATSLPHATRVACDCRKRPDASFRLRRSYGVNTPKKLENSERRLGIKLRGDERQMKKKTNGKWNEYSRESFYIFKDWPTNFVAE